MDIGALRKQREAAEAKQNASSKQPKSEDDDEAYEEDFN